MTIDVVTEITIVRSIKAVAEYAADPDKAPDWYDNIKSIEWESERPLRIGSRIRFTAEFMGRPMTYTYEIEEYDPMSRLVMRTAEGPFPMETTYSWKRESDNSTHMTLRNRGEPSGFSKLAAPFMSWAMRRANRKDLRKLKMILESSEFKVPASHKGRNTGSEIRERP